MDFEVLAAGTAAVWPLWVAPALPALLASTLESALGFGSAIVLLMFSQVFILSSQLRILPEMHPMLTSWEHWRLVITVCQAALLVPCLVAANPRKFACRRTLVGAIPPVLIGTLLGDSLELGGNSGAEVRLALGLVLGAYSVYQLGRILYGNCGSRRTQTESAATAEDSTPSVPCVIVAADSTGRIVQSVSLLEGGDGGGGVVNVPVPIEELARPTVRLFPPSDIPGAGRVVKTTMRGSHDDDDVPQNAIQLTTITVNSDCNPAEIYLLKPDPSCPVVTTLDTPSTAAGSSQVQQSVESRCNICSWTLQQSSGPHHCGHEIPVNMPEDDNSASDDDESSVRSQLLTKGRSPRRSASTVSDAPRSKPVLTPGASSTLQPETPRTRSCQVSSWAKTLCAGISSGLLGGLVGMWGPPIIILLTNSNLSPTQIRATAFCIGGAGCAIRVFTAIAFSKHLRSSWPLYSPVVLVTLFGAYLGFASHKYLCDRRTLFRGLMLTVMLMCAVCLLISACAALLL
mmetsp:Transcript_18434/g.32849  ORF Transcript_18434/g.32849 Transcript_18434/m.32849 type:complete len:515 (-) Transcript_18434:93-1637(-)